MSPPTAWLPPWRRAGSTRVPTAASCSPTWRSRRDGEYAVYDAVRDEAVALGLALVRIEPRRHQLEDLFRTGAEDDRAAWPRPPPARSTTSAIAITRASGSAGRARSRPWSAPGCAPPSGSAARAGRRSCRGEHHPGPGPRRRGGRHPRAGRRHHRALQLRVVPVGHRLAVLHLHRRAGARARGQRHPPSRPAALLQPPDLSIRLRSLEGRRPGDRAPVADAGAGAGPVPGPRAGRRGCRRRARRRARRAARASSATA